MDSIYRPSLEREDEGPYGSVVATVKMSHCPTLPCPTLPCLSLTLEEREREPIPINPLKKENESHKRWLS